jgi:hypothetical protein
MPVGKEKRIGGDELQGGAAAVMITPSPEGDSSRGSHFMELQAYLGKLHCFVKCNLCLCRTIVERRIPCTLVWAIETAGKRVDMRESSIDLAGKGKPKYQFMRADSRQQLVLGKKAVISCVVQVEDGGKVAVLVRNPRQNTASSAAVFGRDEPVSVVAANSGNRKPRVVTAFRSQ